MTHAFFRDELERFGDRYRLTAREHDVLFLLVTGCATVPAIAAQLRLSQNTVHNHFKNVFRRTQTNTKSGLLALFIKEALDRHAGVEPFVRRPRVLIVDSDPSERERMADALLARGIVPHIEADSTRVPERLTLERIDLVVADAALPGAGGRGVLDDVVSRFGRHPMVLLTGEPGGGTRSQWISRGARDFFQKPVVGDRLAFAVIEHCVDSPYDRSRLLRVDTDRPARINESLDAQLGNVGFGGAFVALPGGAGVSRFAIGSRVRVAIDLEGQHAWQAQAEIRWRRELSRPAACAGFGLQFVELRDEQRHELEEFVRQRKLHGLVPPLSEAGRDRTLGRPAPLS